MAWTLNHLRRRTLTKVVLLLGLVILLRVSYFGSSSVVPSLYTPSDSQEIQGDGVIERVTRGYKTLNVQRHKFLQVRMGRDVRDDLLGDVIRNGVNDYWERFQKP
jgi:hypothetical protein